MRSVLGICFKFRLEQLLCRSCRNNPERVRFNLASAFRGSSPRLLGLRCLSRPSWWCECMHAGKRVIHFLVDRKSRGAGQEGGQGPGIPPPSSYFLQLSSTSWFLGPPKRAWPAGHLDFNTGICGRHFRFKPSW